MHKKSAQYSWTL